MDAPHILVLLSGGLDSTVLVGHLLNAGQRVACLAVDYGQRHARAELAAARSVAGHYGAACWVLDLTGLGKLMAGSALTDPAAPMPHGHYTDASMRATVVPARNAVLLMAAAGVASVRGCGQVATAVHAGDHPIYPDCRPEFIRAADATARAATAGGWGDVGVAAPFVQWDKTRIARRGHELAAPLGLTWSCYEGGAVHCGRCGTCTERREAFTLAGIPDPTVYAGVVTPR